MRTVIISGSNGYFGGIAVQYFKLKGWQVLEANRQNNADIFFDLNAPNQIASQKISQPVDLFIHAAAAHEVFCRDYPYKSIFYNVVGTKVSLDFCVNNGIKNFVYLSTFHVFGHPTGNLDESTTPLPANDYGLSHLQAEEYLQMYIRESKIKGVVIRPSNFFGTPANLVRCKRWTLVPLSFCKEAVENKKIVLRTSGLQKRNFVSITDICRVIEKVHELDYPVSLLHVSGPESISIREFAQLVEKVLTDYFHQKIEVNIPNSNNSLVHQEFSYNSRYLKDIYLPVDSLEKFVIDFCGQLKGQKTN